MDPIQEAPVVTPAVEEAPAPAAEPAAKEPSEETPAPPPDDRVWLILKPTLHMGPGEYTARIKGGVRLHTTEPRPFTPAMADRIRTYYAPAEKSGPWVREATAEDFEAIGMEVPEALRPPPPPPPEPEKKSRKK